MAVVAKVEGLNETVAYLKRFDADTLKAMNKELYSVMKGLVQETRGMAPDIAPMSGWAKKSLTGAEWGTRLLYQPARVKTGIRTKIGPIRRKDTDTREQAYFLINANPAGVIYERAGRKTKGSTRAGVQFINNIEQRSGITLTGKQGRLAWKSVYESRDEVTAKMAKIVARYVNFINAKLAA